MTEGKTLFPWARRHVYHDWVHRQLHMNTEKGTDAETQVGDVCTRQWLRKRKLLQSKSPNWQIQQMCNALQSTSCCSLKGKNIEFLWHSPSPFLGGAAFLLLGGGVSPIYLKRYIHKSIYYEQKHDRQRKEAAPPKGRQQHHQNEEEEEREKTTHTQRNGDAAFGCCCLLLLLALFLAGGAAFPPLLLWSGAAVSLPSLVVWWVHPWVVQLSPLLWSVLHFSSSLRVRCFPTLFFFWMVLLAPSFFSVALLFSSLLLCKVKKLKKRRKNDEIMWLCVICRESRLKDWKQLCMFVHRALSCHCRQHVWIATLLLSRGLQLWCKTRVLNAEDTLEKFRKHVC